MRTAYLIGTVILFVSILIISFENWITYPLMIFFSTLNTSLTIGLLFMAFLGICTGFLFALYLKSFADENEPDDYEEKSDESY